MGIAVTDVCLSVCMFPHDKTEEIEATNTNDRLWNNLVQI